MADTWTVMFYFAGDNALAPAVVSQLKALTDAGWHKAVNVVAQFDPNEKGVPTNVYEINYARKAKSNANSDIGDGTDPFVHHLRPDLMSDTAKSLRTAPDKLTPNDALTGFLDYCFSKYKTGHYMLFLLGHGMVVANDTFLSDNYPDASLSLAQLGNILRNFAHKVKQDGKAFDFVGFHSCSMSSLEVAYELSCEKELLDKGLQKQVVDASGQPIKQKGTADYMMASQGVAFVGSWPYRNMLVKLFNLLNQTTFAVKQDLLRNFLSYCSYNSLDFQAAGYSFDLCLCDLGKIEGLRPHLNSLVRELKAALPNPISRNLILLAHWKSQSYWQESYTDLYDFCWCLAEGCAETKQFDSLKTACEEVCKYLQESEDSLIIDSINSGTLYNYSHGLSVYFPWSRPISTDDKIMKDYENYPFNQQNKGFSWHEFLEDYFAKTIRQTRYEEEGLPLSVRTSWQQEVATFAANFEPAGTLAEPEKPFAGHPLSGEKPPFGHGTGASCTCPSIKNHPLIDSSPMKGAKTGKRRAYYISPKLLQQLDER